MEESIVPSKKNRNWDTKLVNLLIFERCSALQVGPRGEATAERGRYWSRTSRTSGRHGRREKGPFWRDTRMGIPTSDARCNELENEETFIRGGNQPKSMCVRKNTASSRLR